MINLPKSLSIKIDEDIFILSESNSCLNVAMLGKSHVTSGSSFHSLITDGIKRIKIQLRTCVKSK